MTSPHPPPVVHAIGEYSVAEVIFCCFALPAHFSPGLLPLLVSISFLEPPTAGGSIGSALAILLFYPLERVRVELQSGGDPASQDRGGEESATSAKGTAPYVRPPSPPAGSPAPSDGSFEVVSHSDAPPQAVDGPPSDSDSDRDGSRGRAGTDASDASDRSERRSAASSEGNGRGPGGDAPDGPETAAAESDDGDAPKPAGRRRPETVLGCLARLHGEGSLYRGASQSVTTATASNGVFFYALHAARRGLDGLARRREGGRGRILLGLAPRTAAGRTLLASSAAGAVNVLLTNPLWVASLRIMESDGPPGSGRPTVWGAVRTIAREEGPGRLWSGTASSLMLVSNPIVQHAVYERLRGALLGRRRGGRPSRRTAAALSPLEAFVLGALAKAAATVVTYPLQ